MKTDTLLEVKRHLAAAEGSLVQARQELHQALSLVEAEYRRQTLPLGPEGVFWNYLKLALERIDGDAVRGHTALVELCDQMEHILSVR